MTTGGAMAGCPEVCWTTRTISGDLSVLPQITMLASNGTATATTSHLNKRRPGLGPPDTGGRIEVTSGQEDPPSLGRHCNRAFLRASEMRLMASADYSVMMSWALGKEPTAWSWAKATCIASSVWKPDRYTT